MKVFFFFFSVFWLKFSRRELSGHLLRVVEMLSIAKEKGQRIDFYSESGTESKGFGGVFGKSSRRRKVVGEALWW